ncbi:hypothetical protein AB3S75_006906 [Citrus x aurantiifolia]
MAALRKIKSPYCIIVLLIMLITFLLSYNSCNPTTETVDTGALKSQPPADKIVADSRINNSLLQLLRRTTMQDRTVIITMVGQEWASPGSVLDLFLESFRIGEETKPLLNHLLIVALDSKAFQYCKTVHPHCFYLSNSSTRYTKKKQLSLPQLRNRFWQEVIELAYSVVFTEVDVMWLRNPILQVDCLKEMTIACDVYSDDLQNISYVKDGGFFYLKSNAITSEYFKYQDMTRILFPDSQNRTLCEETVVNEELFETLSLRINYMEQDRYGGFCQQNINMDTICTVRANCCDDTESKLHDLKLLLEDWRSFTKKNSLRGSSPPYTWRAHSKCKG